MQCKRGKTCDQLKVTVSYFAKIPAKVCSEASQFNIQWVTTFPFVDLHLNTSMFFAMLRCVLIALEPQSTKRWDTVLPLSTYTQRCKINVRRTEAFACD